MLSSHLMIGSTSSDVMDRNSRRSIDKSARATRWCFLTYFEGTYGSEGRRDIVLSEGAETGGVARLVADVVEVQLVNICHKILE